MRLRSAIRPAAPVHINRASPHARGLTHCWGRYGGALYDLLSQTSAGIALPSTEVSSPVVGMGAAIGAGNFLNMGWTSALESPATQTWVAWVYPTTAGADHDAQSWFSVGTTGAIYEWYASLGGGHVNLYTGATGTWLDGTDPIRVNEWNMVAFAVSGSYRGVSANGRPNQTDGGNGAITSPGDVGTIAYYGRRVDGLGGAPSLLGNVAELRRYNRVLSDADLASLYDPMTRWDLYTQPRPLWIDVPAAVAGGGKPWMYYAQQMVG